MSRLRQKLLFASGHTLNDLDQRDQAGTDTDTENIVTGKGLDLESARTNIAETLRHTDMMTDTPRAGPTDVIGWFLGTLQAQSQNSAE